eukprot:Sspe_Gene.83382::Locus_54697_Transcript_1_1_Confidence_1.000_Length_1976::g.83382::m.83382
MLLSRLSALVAREGDTEVELVRKMVFVPLYLMCINAGLGGSLVFYLVYPFNLSIVANLAGAIVSSVGLLHLLATRTLSLRTILCFTMFIMVVIMVDDLERAIGLGARVWPVCVVLVDLLLVCRVQKRFTLLLVTTVLLWIFLTAFEQAFRFGLFDIPYAMGRNPKDAITCSSPPCADVATGASEFLAGGMVFLLDFIMTRGFADAVLQEKAIMHEAVVAADQIATALAAFDLERAEGSLREAGKMPPGLHDALTAILSNLKVYRPYLPQSCLTFDLDEGSSDSAHNTSRSSMESDSRPSAETPKMETRRIDLERRMVTLCIMNMKDSLEELERSGSRAFLNAHTDMLDAAIAACNASKGVIDVFMGDHVFSSFNTVRPCPGHKINALHSARYFLARAPYNMLYNTAVASGFASCGNAGCVGMKRYIIMGNVASRVLALERFGARNGLQLVTDSAVQREAYIKYTMKLHIEALQLECVDSPDDGMVWEVLIDEAGEEGVGEWMYTAKLSSEWDNYNSAAMKFLSERTAPSTLRDIVGDEVPSPQVRKAAETLLQYANKTASQTTTNDIQDVT